MEEMSLFSILVVDDEPTSFDLIESYLSFEAEDESELEGNAASQLQGYELHYAVSAENAIASLDIFDPDLILLDVMMPTMNGIEACQHIKSIARWSNIPIIMITSLTDKKDLAKCLDAGADDFISKPVNRSELQARIRSMLRIHQLTVHLEERIAQRTAQLSNTNQELQQQINERLQAESALKYSEGRFRALVENASDLILLLDKEGIIHYATPSVSRIIGFSLSDLINQKFLVLIAIKDKKKALDLFNDVSHNLDITLSAKLYLQHKSGNEIICETVAKNFSDETGFSGIVLNIRDVSERLRVEAIQQALEHEKKMSEMKLRFFSMTSHEFRTPLSIILMAANVLELNNLNSLNEDQLRNIRRIRASASHLNQMLSDILDIARLEAQLTYKPEPVCLKKLCEDVVSYLKSSYGVAPQISFNYNAEPAEVNIDPQLIHKVLVNLIMNAIKYSHAKQPVKFQVDLSKRLMRFEISDQGIGIPVDNQEHIFDNFYRGSNVGNTEGSGLGLSIVKKCVDLHEGEIILKSQENVGTTIIVELPLN